MKFAAERPLAFLCCVYIFSSLAFIYLFPGTPFFVILSVIITASAVTFFIPESDLEKRRRRRIAASLTAAVAVLAVIRCLFAVLFAQSLSVYADNGEAALTGAVIESDSDDSRISLTVYTDTVNGESVRARIHIEKYYSENDEVVFPSPGDVIECKAALDFNADASDGYYVSKNVFLTGRATDIRIASYGASGFWRLLHAVKSGVIYQTAEFTNGPFIKAVLIGDRSDLDRDFTSAVRRSGLSHFLAVSGLHLTVIAGGFFVLLRALGTHRKVNCVLSAFIALGYMFVCGLSPSVTRAGIMFIIVCLAGIVRREEDPLTSLALAGALIAAVNPYAVSDPGYQLSMLSTFGILYAAIPWTERLGERPFFEKRKGFVGIIKRILYALVSSVAVSVFAVSFSLPVVIIYYGSVTVLSPLFSIPLILIFSPLMYSASAAVAFFALSDILVFAKPALDFIASAFAAAADALCDLFRALIYAFSSVGFGRVSFFAPDAAVISAVTICVLAVLLLKFSDVKFRPLFPAASFGIMILSAFICTAVYRDAAFVYAVSSRTDEKLVVKCGEETVMTDVKTMGYRSRKRDLDDLFDAAGIDTVSVYYFPAYSEKLPSQLELVMRSYDVFSVAVPAPESGEEIGIFLALADICFDHGAEIAEYDASVPNTFAGFTFDNDPAEKGAVIIRTPGGVGVYSTPCKGGCEAKNHNGNFDVVVHPLGKPVSFASDGTLYFKRFVYPGDEEAQNGVFVSVDGSKDLCGFSVFKNAGGDISSKRIL